MAKEPPFVVANRKCLLHAHNHDIRSSQQEVLHAATMTANPTFMFGSRKWCVLALRSSWLYTLMDWPLHTRNQGKSGTAVQHSILIFCFCTAALHLDGLAPAYTQLKKGCDSRFYTQSQRSVIVQQLYSVVDWPLQACLM